MSNSVKSTGKIIENITETGISAFKSGKYVLWKISKNWKEITGKEIGTKSFPKKFYEGKLTVNVSDPVIYHSIVIHSNIIVRKINEFFRKEIVNELEIKKINERIRRNLIEEMTGKIEEEEIKKVKSADIEEIEEEIELPFSEMEDIRKCIRKIDEKYEDIREKLEKIAINRKKKDIFLISRGYIKCEKCQDIFYPLKNQKICFNCYEKEENIKQERMMKIITENPLIGEREAVSKAGTEWQVYYKVRDILAQRSYNELLDFYITKNIEIEYSEDYKNEIKNEANIDFEVYVKNYIDYKIGTDDKNVFNIERKKIIRKLKNEREYMKKYK